jgi:tRNA G46 methylase TrmB
MKRGGLFHIKTDHRGYFEWMMQAIQENLDLWEVVSVNEDLHRNHSAPHLLDFPEVTLFEKLFIRDQIPIHDIKLRVRK